MKASNVFCQGDMVISPRTGVAYVVIDVDVHHSMDLFLLSPGIGCVTYACSVVASSWVEKRTWIDTGWKIVC